MGERRFSTKNRFVSFLLAIAMVLTLLPVPPQSAKVSEPSQLQVKNLQNGSLLKTFSLPFFPPFESFFGFFRFSLYLKMYTK